MTQSPQKFKDLPLEPTSADPLSQITQNEHVDIYETIVQQKRPEGTLTIEERLKLDAESRTAEVEEKVSWWSGIRDSVKSAFVSKQTEEAFWDVLEVFKMFFKDSTETFAPVDVTLALLVIYNSLAAHHKGVHLHTDLRVTDLQLIDRITHFMKFASAAYGWKFHYAYKPNKKGSAWYPTFIEGLKNSDQLNRAVLLEHTTVSPPDILQERWNSPNPFSPGHFLALDHSTKSLVLAIRGAVNLEFNLNSSAVRLTEGTFHVRDAMTDLCARYEPFKGGMAHSGILKAAKEKHAEVTPLLVETLQVLLKEVSLIPKKFPDYKLVISGHSLGAGTAALLAVILYDELLSPFRRIQSTFPKRRWTDEKEYELKMECFCYAPPCVLSLDLAAKCRHFVTSVVLNNDVVPRLCYSSMEDFKHLVTHLSSQSDNGKLQRLFQVISVGNSLGDGLTKKLSEYLECSPTPDLSSAKLSFAERLHPPGKIYHIYGPRWLDYNLMEESAPSLFNSILLTGSMFSDHMPNEYERALDLVRERIVKELQKETKEGKATEEISPETSETPTQPMEDPKTQMNAKELLEELLDQKMEEINK